jgi:hypothetical protein
MNSPRKTNRSLNKTPRYLNIFPAEMFLPWAGIGGGCFLGYQMFHFPGIWCAGFGVWGCATWWLFIGNEPWKQLSKLMKTPNWTTAQAKYQSSLRKNTK